MNGYERQWLLVVLVCVSLLTLFTANGLPLLDQNAEFGIKDDPAENQVLSLSERDAQDENSSDKPLLSNVAGLAVKTATNTTRNTTNTSARPELHNTTKSPKPLNSSGLNITDDAFKTKNLTTTASPQNVSINATRTGNITLPLTRNQSSPANILIKPSQTIKVVLKNSSGLSLSTYTNSLKPSLTWTPSGNSTKVSAIGSPSVSLNPSLSAAILTNPTTSVSSIMPTSVSSSSLLTQSATKIPSTKNSTGTVSTHTGIPVSTQSSSSLPSAQGTSSAPSTQNPSTKSTTEVSSTQKTLAHKSTKPVITTKLSTASSTGVVSSLPPTTEVKAPKSTTQESTRKPSTQASKKPSTKETSIAPSTKKALSTVPKEPTTNAEVETTKKAPTKQATTKKATTKKATTKKAATKKATTKKATTKPVVSEKKTTAVKTKANNENNDEGKMPPPDQGREAVIWDFIVPVAIGTGVALAIAFGVILVRTCRRRKLIKVRFGGKPSHPRLLNNDLINLLAESDDEEE